MEVVIEYVFYSLVNGEMNNTIAEVKNIMNKNMVKIVGIG